MADIVGGTTMRNRVINGCCRVSQRSAVSLTTSNQFGVVDRMMGSYVNGSAGTLTNTSSIGTFKRGLEFYNVTLSSGYVTFRHRIEALNTLDLSGQTVTVSAKVLHNYGSTTDVKIGLRKPSASDNFASTSVIGTDATVAVATGTQTVVSATYNLGSTDADNGLEIVMYHDAVSVTTKSFAIGDIQLTLGSEVEQFERRPIGVEDLLCKRYFYRNSGNVYACTIGGSSAAMWHNPAAYRSTPTMSGTAPGGSLSYAYAAPNVVQMFLSGYTGGYATSITADAEL